MKVLTFILNELPMLILLATTIIGVVNNIKAKKKLTDADMLKSINDLVSQAESIYKAGNGDSKMNYVLAQLKVKYPNLDETQLKELTEASLKVFQDFIDNGKIDGSTTTPAVPVEQPNILQQVINTPPVETPQNNQ